MSPSPKSQVMTFASPFSRIGDFFRICGIHTFYATTGHFVEYMNMHAIKSNQIKFIYTPHISIRFRGVYSTKQFMLK